MSVDKWPELPHWLNLRVPTIYVVCVAAALLGAAIIVLASLGIFGAKSPFSHYRYYLDINSGRMKKVGFFRSQITNTSLTNALQPEDFAGRTPDWRYDFAGAFNTVFTLETIWIRLDCSPAVRRKMAKDVLSLWQYADDPSLADRYVIALLDLDPNELSASLQRLMETRVCEVRKTDGLEEHIARWPDGNLMDTYILRGA